MNQREKLLNKEYIFRSDAIKTMDSLIPMSAFYEWKKEGSKKVPYRIFLKTEDLFFVPALYYNSSASLITTTPNVTSVNVD